MVQIAHSALEAGRDLGKPSTPSHLILLGAKSEAQLLDISQALKLQDIKFSLFFEPDYDTGYTSLTTEPLYSDEARKYFRKFKLYTFKELA